MKNDRSGSLSSLVLLLGQTQRLHSARLMTPVEVAAAVRDRSGQESTASGWHLCVSINPQMFELVVANIASLKEKIYLSKMPLGYECLVIAQQIGNWTHRIHIPLIGVNSLAWVKSLESGMPIHLAIANGDSEDAIIRKLTCPAIYIPLLLDAFQPLGDSTAELVRDMLSNAVQAVFAPAEGHHGYLAEVCVSWLVPEELDAIVRVQVDAIRKKHFN